MKKVHAHIVGTKWNTFCKMQNTNFGYLFTGDWSEVTCKRCLARKKKK